MKILINLDKESSKKFYKQWNRYSFFFTKEKTPDTIISVESDHSTPFVDDSGILHINSSDFRLYITIIDSLMEKISSGELTSKEIILYIIKQIQKNQ